MKNQTMMNEDQAWKLEDCGDQTWMNEGQVWEPEIENSQTRMKGKSSLIIKRL